MYASALAGSSTEHVFNLLLPWEMKMATAKLGWYNIDRGCACFQEKYYLGYVLLEQLQMKVYVWIK